MDQENEGKFHLWVLTGGSTGAWFPQDHNSSLLWKEGPKGHVTEMVNFNDFQGFWNLALREKHLGRIN